MENMDQLKDLLKHEIKDLYSAEEQIIEALPKMIEKANNKKLKQTLEEHLSVTEEHKERLDEVLQLLEGEDGEDKGFTSGLFKNSKAGEKCKAMEGLIAEAESLMKEDMSSGVSDAAIIAAAQKIEHYEISSYGTARAYAQELNLDEVESLLKETLDEEYEADDRLTELAETRINLEAIAPESSGERSQGRKRSQAGSRSQATAKAASHDRSRSRASSNDRGSSRSSSNGRGNTRSASNARTKSSSGSRSKTSSSRAKKSSRSR
jgi:ferritin-like metal-binding protein YciE